MMYLRFFVFEKPKIYMHMVNSILLHLIEYFYQQWCFITMTIILKIVYEANMLTQAWIDSFLCDDSCSFCYSSLSNSGSIFLYFCKYEHSKFSLLSLFGSLLCWADSVQQ
jgi:hypothetical protein